MEAIFIWQAFQANGYSDASRQRKRGRLRILLRDSPVFLSSSSNSSLTSAAHDLADVFVILICRIALRKTLVETAPWQVVRGWSARLPHPPSSLPGAEKTRATLGCRLR